MFNSYLENHTHFKILFIVMENLYYYKPYSTHILKSLFKNLLYSYSENAFSKPCFIHNGIPDCGLHVKVETLN